MHTLLHIVLYILNTGMYSPVICFPLPVDEGLGVVYDAQPIVNKCFPPMKTNQSSIVYCQSTNIHHIVYWHWHTGCIDQQVSFTSTRGGGGGVNGLPGVADSSSSCS